MHHSHEGVRDQEFRGWPFVDDIGENESFVVEKLRVCVRVRVCVCVCKHVSVCV